MAALARALAPGVAAASGTGAALPPSSTPSFAFVIPTYNEASDITATLAAVLAQRLSPREIIVVDGGSSDGTLDVLRAHAAKDRRITVIEEGRRRGVSAARNAGIRRAATDIVVILNADVCPDADFLERLAPLYAAGADAVSVDARVQNNEDATGRYLQAEHRLHYGTDRVGWSEGFSCRRDAALAAGFPEEIPGAGGEDVVFFDRLLAGGARWRVEYDVCVPHRVPATLRGFWTQWRSRGNAVPYAELRLRRLSLPAVTVRRAAAAAWSLVRAVTFVPNAVSVVLRARYSPRGLRDLPRFLLLLHVQALAHRTGEWQTLLKLWRTPEVRR